MIRSSKHSFAKANETKKRALRSLLHEYRRVGSMMVTQMWAGLFSEEKDGKTIGFKPGANALDCPQFVDYRKFSFRTELSARMLRCLSTQVCGYLSAATEKRRRVFWAISKGFFSNKKKGKKLRQQKAVKPDFSHAPMSLNSICADAQDTTAGLFFLQLKSLGKKYGKLRLPVQETRVSLKWLAQGKRLAGISISENGVMFSYEVTKRTPSRPSSTDAGIVGVDQGLLTVASLSSGAKTPETDRDGHSLSSILDRLARKKKGGKSFARSAKHRDNFIRWSLNQLNKNFSAATEVRLEKVWNIGFKKRSSRKLSHWTNTVIRDKIAAICEEAEVPLILQESSYRSQRCGQCGIVRKSQRKEKLYSCNTRKGGCGWSGDADYNASCNHKANLPDVTFYLRSQKLNRKGFFWKEEGFYDLEGGGLATEAPQEASGEAELTVPPPKGYTLKRPVSEFVSRKRETDISL